MSMAMLKSGLSPIALEFGASSLKALQLAGGERPSVVAAAQLDTPGELLDSDEARLQFQLEGIAGLLKGAGFKGKRVVCSVTATRTFVQHLHVPKVDGVSTDQAIKMKLRELLERSPREIILKTVEIGEVVRESGKMIEVLCIAMPREVVLGHMQSLRSARLEVVGIFSEHMAAVRPFESSSGRGSGSGGCTMLVDLGYATTKAMITHGGALRFAKSIALGGRDFDRVLSRDRSVPLAIARNQRCGIYAVAGAGGRSIESQGAEASGRGEDSETEGGGGGGALAEALGALPEGFCRKRTRLLIEELGRAVAYHGALFASKRPSKVVFFGGEARRSEFVRALATGLGMRSFVGDPMALIDGTDTAACTNVCLAAAQPGWTVPLGLCLSPTDL
ncbi:MAG: hypothetical protein ACTS3F_11620 [Phycisphaerales bacterium]